MPRLTVEFSEKVTDILAGIAARNSTTKVEVVRKALSLYDYVDRGVSCAVPRGSRKLAIVDEHGEVVQEIVVP